MNPWMIGAGIGLLKGLGPDRWKEDRERNLAANTQRFSPWTGLKAGPIEEADPLGSGMQGAFTGLSMDQNNKSFMSQLATQDAYRNYLAGANNKKNAAGGY